MIIYIDSVYRSTANFAHWALNIMNDLVNKQDINLILTL